MDRGPPFCVLGAGVQAQTASKSGVASLKPERSQDCATKLYRPFYLPHLRGGPAQDLEFTVPLALGAAGLKHGCCSTQNLEVVVP